MTTRVRYSNIDGTLIATNLVSTTLGDTLTVSLYPQTMEALIRKSDKTTAALVAGKSLAMLKKNVKLELLNLGVVFLSEVRNTSSIKNEIAA